MGNKSSSNSSGSNGGEKSSTSPGGKKSFTKLRRRRTGAAAESGDATAAAAAGTPSNSNEQQDSTAANGAGDRSSAGGQRPSSGDAELKISYWQMIRGGYEELVNAIIRPPRAEYDMDMLGPKKFRLNGNVIVRNDFQLTNQRGLKLECSHWQPQSSLESGASPLPCMIYLHGNASCRAEALECLPIVLSTGISLLSFDFAGSGKSEGEYISLGYFEQHDVGTVMEHLREQNLASAIGIWGRSMGAVTALMYADSNPSISCLVLDSPFASLRQLAKELVEHAQIQVPKWAVGMALKFVRSSVKSRAGFDINKLEPINHAKQCFVPVFFGAAEEDDFIRPHHSQQLHDEYFGSKNITLFPGDHNTTRPAFFLHSVSIFLTNTMVTPYGLSPQQLSSSASDNKRNRDSGTQDWADAAPREGFHMPAPLSPSGAGLGIDVGIPDCVPGAGVNQFYFTETGTLGNSNDMEAYYQAMILQAIQQSLEEQRGSSQEEVALSIPEETESSTSVDEVQVATSADTNNT